LNKLRPSAMVVFLFWLVNPKPLKRLQCYFFVIRYTTTCDNNFEILLKEHYLVSIFAKINCLEGISVKSNLSKLKLYALVAFLMLVIVSVHKAKHNLLVPSLICVTWKFIRTPWNIGLQLQLALFNACSSSTKHIDSR
jgi:hypothetical protein